MQKKVLYSITCILMLCCAASYSQIISTIAGSGKFGNAPDGTPALNAPLFGISCVRVDNAGFIYLNDGYNNCIKKIDQSTGLIYTFAGNTQLGFSGDGGNARLASLRNPLAFAIDRQGNMFVCDTYNNRIRKIDAGTNIIHTIAGNGTAAFSDGSPADQTGLPQPSSIDIDNAGNLYIGSSEFISFGNNNYIFKIDAVSGIVKKIAGNGTNIYNGSGVLALQSGFYITGLRVNVMGDIYFADPVHNCILWLNTTTGIIKTIAGSGTISSYGYKGDGGPAINALLNAPVDVSFDADNNLLIEDEGSSAIRKIDMLTGMISTVAGNGILGYSGDGMLATCARLHPFNGHIDLSGITADNNRNLYIIDQGNSRMRKVNTEILVPKNPDFTINTPSTNICPGDHVVITGTINSDVMLAQDQIAGEWFKNGVHVGNDSLIYRADDIKNNDIAYCILHTVNNMCQSVDIQSNSLVFNNRSAINPTINITPDNPAVCPGQAITFTASASGTTNPVSFEWQLNGNKTGSTESIYTDQDPGNGDNIQCILITTDPACAVPLKIPSNTISVRVKDISDVTLSPIDTIIKPGSQVKLQAVISGNTVSYYWSPPDHLSSTSVLEPIATPLKTTKYYFEATSTDGCTTEKTLLVRIPIPLLMPNTFTPNNDGKNELFRIPPDVSISLKEFSIYNRSGRKIFTTENAALGWDGTFNGIQQPAGTYVYVISGTADNQPVFLKGTVILFR